MTKLSLTWRHLIGNKKKSKIATGVTHMSSKYISVRSQQKRRWKTRRICLKNKNIRTTQFRMTKFNTLLFRAANIAYTGRRWNKQEHEEMSDFLSRYRKVHQNYFRHFWQSLMKSGIRWVWYCLQIWLRIFRNLIGETRLYSSSKS